MTMDSIVGMRQALRYQTGFGNAFESEALPGALPVGRNSPQRCAYGLYAEQLSGSPFTAPRARNERSWLYRIRPTVAHWGRFAPRAVAAFHSAPCAESAVVPPTPLRWDPFPLPPGTVAFPDGVTTITTCGDVAAQTGMAAHVYALTASMGDAVFHDADGEMLFVPEHGGLRLCTEFGVIETGPCEIAVIPRGVTFRLELTDEAARGYLCENYGAALTLPERGPIGANCLANPRDFLTPHARYEDIGGPFELTVKWGGRFWRTELDHSPLDVVAWHGNYAPYKYDLRRFAPVGPLLFDHADPSIFTVLTSASETPGTANLDFVIFPERWAVAEDTFRPPWYHRNIMSEFMGLVTGAYDAKKAGFVPGGFSLHNCMLPHGPDAESFAAASTAALAPVRLRDTLAFMFETRLPQQVTRAAAESPCLQPGYATYGAALPRRFDPSRP